MQNNVIASESHLHFEAGMVFVEAYSHNDYVDLKYACFIADSRFVQTLQRLQKVCQTQDLAGVRVEVDYVSWFGTRRWAPAKCSLHVSETAFHFSTTNELIWPASAQSRPISIQTFMACMAGQSGNHTMQWHKGDLYIDENGAERLLMCVEENNA